MRRLILILAVSAALAWLAAPPSSATSLAGGYDAATAATCGPCTTGYLQDGNGAGDAASLIPGVLASTNEPLLAEPVNGGAWRWDMYDEGLVQDGLFTDKSLESATQNAGDHVFLFRLHADTDFCMVNSDGGAWSQDCNPTTGVRALWVFDSRTGYWINVGRSNDKGNREILCNPGGGGQLIITTADNCTDYHEEWAFEPG
jgi:hypothetical protein